MHKKWKVYKRQSDYYMFSNLRKEIKSLQKSCYDLFISRAENNIKKDSKQFWSFIKSKKDINSIPDTLYLDNCSGSDGFSIANLFSSFFQSVFVSDTCDTPKTPPHVSNACIIESINITPAVVEKYLSRINVSKGSGPDDLHPLFLRNCCKELALPIALLFDLSLTSGVMPTLWKKSLVVPIYKSGDKHNVRNYRGISKLSIIPKVFEKIIYDSLFPAIRPFLILQQHGFIDRRSTETNLCEFLDQVLDGMDNGFQVDAVYTDYSKCFDKISHKLLVAKLEYIGIHGDLLRWLQSYLSNRSQAVTIKGYLSSFVPVPSGVPQGSHLGPLLFNIFINDVAECFHYSKFILFADDTKIFKKIRTVDDCLNLQSDLDRLCNYCETNKLSLNVDKCSFISFTRKKHPIIFNYKLCNINLNKVTEVRDLGVTLDCELLFSTHVNKITTKAYKMLGFIFRQTVDFVNPETLILLYNCFVRSQLEYASTAWNPQYLTYINLIEKIQHKFIKRLKFKFKNQSFNLVPLELRREQRDLTLLYKIINNHVESPYLLSKISFRCPRANLRSCNTFAVPLSRTNYAANRFIPRSMNAYNSKYGHIDVFNIKLPALKASFKKKSLVK